MKLIKKWRQLIKNKRFLVNLGLSLLFLFSTFAILKTVGKYAEIRVAPALPDVVHSLLPLVDVGFIATFGFLAIIATFWIYLILAEPKRLPYAIKLYGIFIIFRSIFIFVTGLGAPSIRIDDTSLINIFVSGLYFTQDLFPSGHTAIPFLSYLIVKNRNMKYLMFTGSLVMGASVLLLHVHYTIDVIGAFFVAYGSKGFYHWIKDKAIPQVNYFLEKIKTALNSPNVTVSK